MGLKVGILNQACRQDPCYFFISHTNTASSFSFSLSLSLPQRYDLVFLTGLIISRSRVVTADVAIFCALIFPTIFFLPFYIFFSVIFCKIDRNFRKPFFLPFLLFSPFRFKPFPNFLQEHGKTNVSIVFLYGLSLKLLKF